MPARLASLLIAFACGLGAAAGQPVPVTIAYVASAYNAVPIVLARERGAFERAGLAPVFASYPSAGQQIVGLSLRTWDIGVLGGVAAVFAAGRHDLWAVAATDDEGAAQAVLGRPGTGFDALRGRRVAATANSGSWLTLLACLARRGFAPRDIEIVPGTPADGVAALRAGSVAALAVGPPWSLALERREGMAVLCNAEEAELAMPGAVLVRRTFARDHPEVVGRFLAVYFGMPLAGPDALAALRAAYAEAGEVDDAALRMELVRRPRIDRRTQAAAPGWFGTLGQAIAVGTTLGPVPQPLAYVTDRYLREMDALRAAWRLP